MGNPFLFKNNKMKQEIYLHIGNVKANVARLSKKDTDPKEPDLFAIALQENAHVKEEPNDIIIEDGEIWIRKSFLCKRVGLPEKYVDFTSDMWLDILNKHHKENGFFPLKKFKIETK